MTRRTRRSILGAAGAVLLAGCSSDDEIADSNSEGSNGDTDSTSTPATDLDGSSSGELGGSSNGDSGGSSGGSSDDVSSSGNVTTLIDETQTAPDSGYYQWPFTINTEVELSLTAIVRSGPAVDIYLTTSAELEEYKQGNRFGFNSALSVENSTFAESTSVVSPRDDLVLLVDNSTAGEAEPPTDGVENPAEVEVELTATEV
ncbi:hypothetical protein [Haloarcula salinisoli]|uniref:Uncharacterized protein n=1 Tax=Haloarcula salinisoli TaxID=2487746 RepID=A0A8J7YHJ0_9EURY|nr:hypothetical protein [Halomicroarcula salinisoli]MBX0303114.1 hypothetical protein [Halomicroarcula salinisoli]